MKDRLEKFPNSLKISLGLIILLLLFAWLSIYGKLPDNPPSLRLMFYNVENLFDTIDSELDDAEFLPNSDRAWSSYKYYRKLDNIAKVIISSGTWSSPDIIGLCEVENELVLTDLANRTILKESRYNVIYSETNDSRGIGLGLLYKNSFDLISRKSFFPSDGDGNLMQTRSVLHIQLADKSDTLNIILTHFPSRRGGVAATDPLRENVARLIDQIIISIQEEYSKKSKIVILGDFNCNPESYVLRDILRVKAGPEVSEYGDLVNISSCIQKDVGGSYRYQGEWNLFDQAIISTSLLKSLNGYVYKNESFRVVSPPLILTVDNAYRGLKPLPTWTGPRYEGGFSDHLPITLDLVVK